MSQSVNVIEKPNRRTIERLLRELRDSARVEYDNFEYRKANGAAEKFEKELLKNATLKRLRRIAREKYEVLHEKSRVREALVNRVRRLYEANGLTPYVQSELNQVLSQFEKPILTYHMVEQMNKADARRAKKPKSKKKK